MAETALSIVPMLRAMRADNVPLPQQLRAVQAMLEPDVSARRLIVADRLLGKLAVRDFEQRISNLEGKVRELEKSR
jgi:hypothetical protein